MANDYISKQDVLNLPQSIERNLRGEIVERSIDVKDIEALEPADVIPIKWIQKKIDKSIGMEHAMWSKLLRMWENKQLRKYVRNLKDDNK